MNSIDPALFLHMKPQYLLLDVRSPGEYALGHIPGALSFPLFTDEERVAVGTSYKQQGKEKAFELGLRFVGPKMEDFVKDARRLSKGRHILLHCWRGGQRSASMAWLLRQARLNVTTLSGGYKAYRQHILNHFYQLDLPIKVIGGRTGAGKTKVLRALQQAGEQIIDLERLACHKGSAFGFIGESEQPTVEQFENELFEAASALDPNRTVWVENESRSIGRVFIPDGFWEAMKRAPLFNLVIPFEARLENLIADYTADDRQHLAQAFNKIEKKLGGLKLKQALEYLQNGQLDQAARIALQYYDKTYQHCLEQNQSPEIHVLEFPFSDPQLIADELRNKSKKAISV